MRAMPPGGRCCSLSIGLAISLLACRPSARCDERFQAGDFSAAETACAAAVAAGDPGAARKRAQALLQLGRDDELHQFADRARSQPWSAPVLLASGKAWTRTQQPDRARGEYLGALSMAVAASDADTEARAAWGLSRYHLDRTEYRAALTYARQCHAATLRTGNEDLIGIALLDVFDVLYEIGDDESALQVLAQAKLHRDKSPGDRAPLLVKEGLLHQRVGRIALSRDRYVEALSLARDAGLHAVQRAALQNLFELALESGDLTSAGDWLAQAQKLLEVGGRPEMDRRISLLYREARLALARKQPDRALASIERARAASPSVDWTWQLDVEAGRASEQRGDLPAAERSYQEAISILETTRKELGADDFKASLLAAKREPYERLFALRAAAGREREAVAAAEMMLARVFLDAFVGSRAASAEPAREIDLVDRADSLRSLLPALRASPIASPRPIEEVLEALRGDYVLEWIDAGGAIWLIRVDHGVPAVQRLHTTVADLDALSARWTRNLDDASAAAALAAAILPPGALPPRGRDLFLVANGQLARLPLSALQVGRRRLIQDYVVHHVPSLSALVAIRSVVRPGGGIGMAFVDPRGDLPGARVEAAAAGMQVIAGNQATRARVREAAHAPLLHFGTHAGFAAHGGWLELADGTLRASDVLDLGLRPGLVVLAGCATSGTHSRELSGSLAGSFLAAGSASVVASLWSVEDAAAARLISLFYRQPDYARNPAAALAASQRILLAAGNAPSFWSPFLAIGN